MVVFAAVLIVRPKQEAVQILLFCELLINKYPFAVSLVLRRLEATVISGETCDSPFSVFIK